MALIEDTVGELPYQLTDFDQHSYEAEDCFTRFMPKAKLDNAVRPIVAPSGRKVLLANDQIVTALENDLDQAYVPGSLVEMLKQRASGDATAADRFYEPMQTEYLDRDARLKQLTEQQIERAIMYPGGWALTADAIFKKHVRVVPYPEDDTVSMIEKLGTDETLLMGSDWPHAEGLREPADFYHKVDGLDETKKRNFLRENGIKLSEGID